VPKLPANYAEREDHHPSVCCAVILTAVLTASTVYCLTAESWIPWFRLLSGVILIVIVAVHATRRTAWPPRLAA
jgi:high-affinity Fe2+/Pb2+ permease